VRLSHSVALCLLLFLPSAARADDIGPEQAQVLQQQLKDCLAGLLGPTVKLPDMPWRITSEHDHYQLTWPIPGVENPADNLAVTASIRPLDGGRWSIDGVKAPPAAKFTVTVPDKTDDLTTGSPMKVAYTIGTQDTHAAILDPTERDALKIANQLLRFRSIMCLDECDTNFRALFLQKVRFLQHLVGLADACRSPYVDTKARPLTLIEFGEKRLR
jgi:hypothetical protein